MQRIRRQREKLVVKIQLGLFAEFDAEADLSCHTGLYSGRIVTGFILR